MNQIAQQQVDVQRVLQENAALREEIGLLRRQLAEARAIAQADEATQLGRTLLSYVLDVLCAMLTPERGQTIVAGPTSLSRADLLSQQSGIGPFQAALERPRLERALQGQATTLSTRYESTLWLPVIHGARTAVILCLRRAPGRPFSELEQEIGALLGMLMISALQTGHRCFDLHDEQDALRALNFTLQARIPHSGGPVAALARDAERLAARFGIDAAGRTAIRQAAILHDIGMVDLAEDLLQKQENLNADEIKGMREHAVFGAEIVRTIAGMEAVIPPILHHHERWDGTGYPAGLAAGDIPIGARIIAVVDAFHAMVNPRPHRPSRSVDDALHELRLCAGAQFDRNVVEAFVQMVIEGV